MRLLNMRGMTPPAFKTAHEMARSLRARKISARELLQQCLTQYARHNDAINAVVYTDLDRAQRGRL